MMQPPRPLSVVPRPVYLLLLIGLLLQGGQHLAWPVPEVRMQTLPQPMPAPWLRVLSFGEPIVLAKVLMLWLQAFDYQAGLELTLKDFDPEKLEGWLETILLLDPKGQYPLVAAVRFYGESPVPDHQRRFAAFAYRQFFVDPPRRWPWLAHAAIQAKHRLHDLPLALHYAQAIRIHTAGNGVPSWAKHMEVVLLEEMGEYHKARMLMETFLTDGTVRDPREIHFLKERLRFLEGS